MKNSSDNLRVLRRGLLACLGVALACVGVALAGPGAAPGGAGSPEIPAAQIPAANPESTPESPVQSGALDCLDRYDLGCAAEAIAGMGGGAEAAYARAKYQFFTGDFAAAAEGMAKLEGAYGETKGFAAELALYQSTQAATDGFRTETRPGAAGAIVIRSLPGVDQVMVDEAFETLAGAQARIGGRLGGAPPDGVRLEIYPTIPRFIGASSLPAEAVRTTGVVALSKWTRLLLTSPRALGRGYAWKDTLAHEYVHYIVAWRTRDRAPVWLQEGIARSHEMYWREGAAFELAPYSQSLLAQALQNDSFVPLEKMSPSIAFLDSAAEAALAYAQVSTMVVYLEQAAGPTALSQVLDRVRDGQDALMAMVDVGAKGDKSAFFDGWKAVLRGMGLVQRKLEGMPTGVPGAAGAGGGFEMDPVLAKRRDLANLVRLGDLLAERDHLDAAMVEYRKATPEDEPPSPMLSERIARLLLKQGDIPAALAVLKQSTVDYPEYAATHELLGDLLLKASDQKGALAAYRASADINPFDIGVQGHLADLYAAAGQQDRAERHAGYRRVLELGGIQGTGQGTGQEGRK